MNLSSTIKRFSRKVTVTRHYPGVYAEGSYKAGGIELLSLKVVVQPASARQLEMLMEGERANGAMMIHSLEKLNIGGSKDAPADLVEVDGYSYKLSSEIDGKFNGNFYSYIAIKEGQ